MTSPLTIPITGGSKSMNWGSVLSGIGSGLQGLGSLAPLFEGKSDGIDVSENVRLNQALGPVAADNALMMGNAQVENYLKQMNAQIRAGKEYKIHRLAMLGQPLLGSGAQTVMASGQSATGSRSKDAFSAAGQAALNAAQAMTSMKESQSRVNLNNAQAADILNQQATRNAQSSVSSKDKGRIDKYVHVYNNFTGKYEWMVNPELGVEYPETYGAALLGRASAQDVIKAPRGNYGPTDVAP